MVQSPREWSCNAAGALAFDSNESRRLSGFPVLLVCSRAVLVVQMSAPQKLAGECKWFNSKKGFGFITPKDGSEEVTQTDRQRSSGRSADAAQHGSRQRPRLGVGLT